MNEKPILFSTEMIKAILDGHKTQTRRIVRLTEFQKAISHGYDWMFRDKRGLWNEVPTSWLLRNKCPYGRPGDMLWVRETWAIDQGFDSVKPSDISDYWGGLYYKATGDKPAGKWRPSIFMPRWASRITLRVQDVRVERVQDITIDDAGEEGCSGVISGGYDFDIYNENGDYARHPYIMNFRRLWDSINAKRGFSWDSNPWVWVIDFEEVKK